MWARRCVMWCFLRKTLQSLNPSLPPKLPTELLRPPESPPPPTPPPPPALEFFLFLLLFFFYRLCTHNVLRLWFFFNLVCELMCLRRFRVSSYCNCVITSKYASDSCTRYFCCGLQLRPSILSGAHENSAWNSCLVLRVSLPGPFVFLLS